ncbi:calcium/sodium antiporter [Marilutibacter aestuarii]|uniref:Calcium/sodium antiporter n=1 Tax=Marilutibacter aestuarii TaxID=1706195 RepID=A0A507ZQB3_9GAMM|nr:calcium/sodium antiporter [Lysobacter aestuarii]TQD39519.1 calcium/sodium antiporter [Lysobacter aestuarii]
MTTAIVMFALGLALLALGGDSIVKGASGLAQRLGLSPFVAGLLLVAFGTSLPELAVNLQAVLAGEQALALGNAIGSNIVNFGLTLGAAALAAPLLVRWRALSPMLLLLLLGTLLVIAFSLDGALGRLEGAGMLVAFVAVVAFALVRTRREAPEVQDAISAYARTQTGLGLNLIRFAVAAVLLYFGARLVVQNAAPIGAAMGMTPLLTGLLPVAIATALPEMAAAIAAARRGQGDMVAGHVIGSSLFNLLVVLGAMAVWQPVPMAASFVHFELPAALLFALMLVPMLRGDLRISRAEGGILMLGLLGWIAMELVSLYA